MPIPIPFLIGGAVAAAAAAVAAAAASDDEESEEKKRDRHSASSSSTSERSTTQSQQKAKHRQAIKAKEGVKKRRNQQACDLIDQHGLSAHPDHHSFKSYHPGELIGLLQRAAHLKKAALKKPVREVEKEIDELEDLLEQADELIKKG